VSGVGAPQRAQTTPRPRPRAAAFLREHWPRVLGTALLLGVFFGNQGFGSLVRNWLELRRLRREIVSLSGEEADLDRKLRLLRSGHGQLERAARRELGFIRKGEIEYRFEPPSREKAK